MVWCTVQRSI